MAFPIGVDCELYGKAPLQGNVRVDGHPYFRARDSLWTFTVCINHDIDPSLLRGPKSDGWFTEDEYVCFELSAHFNGASSMSYVFAHEIIAGCVVTFRDAIQNRSSSE